MDFFSLIRRLDWRFRDRPARKARPEPKKRLGLEALESRELLAVAPFVTGVAPASGATLGADITVSFSENVVGAADANNYRLFDSSGAAVTIGTITYNPATFQATITADQLNGGVPLFAGNYSLFLLGDRIVDTDDNLPISPAGSLVVANAGDAGAGQRNLSTTTLLPDGTLTASVNRTLAANALPTAVALRDLDNDFVLDLIVANGGLNNVSIFQGGPNGTFSATPDLTLTLPAGANPSGLAFADFNNDLRTDVAVANRGTNSVSVFRNTSGFNITFAPAVTVAAGNAPNGIVVGNFNNDARPDIAVSNGTVNGTAFTASVLTFNQDGTFGFQAAVAVNVGDTTPTNLNNPTGIAVGRFNNDAADDLAVSGARGLAVLTNTSTTAAAAFNVAFVAAPNTTSVVAGALRSGAGGNTQDILATAAGVTPTTNGRLVAFLNDGAGAFAASGAIDAGVLAPAALTRQNLDGAGADEMLYLNSNATGGLVVAPIVRAGRVADATNAAPIVITSANHGLVNGQRVSIANVAGNNGANGTFYIQNVTANTFELVGSAGTGAATANTGAWVALPGIITNATGTGVAPIVITSPNHGLQTGQQVVIAGVGGNTNANGRFFVTRLDANQFSLNGTTGNGAYTARTGTFTALPYATGANPAGLALGNVSSLTALDVFTANRTDSSLTYYRGSLTNGQPDGTFVTSTDLRLAGGNNVSPSGAAVGDVNGDGLRDLVTVDEINDRAEVFLALAAGGYSQPVTFNTVANGVGTDPTSVTLADLNLDGNLDILAASMIDNVVSVLLGNGDGTFGSATTFTVGRAPTDVIAADINRDGAPDLIVTHNGPGGAANRGVTVRLGNGNGTFGSITEFLADVRAVGVAASDLDRDGDLDLVVLENRGTLTGRIHRLVNNGTGGLTAVAATTVTSGSTDFTLADFDSDGFTDVAVVSGTAAVNNVSVLLNAGGTAFAPAINTTLAPSFTLASVAAFNVNDDAFLDLVVTTQAPSSTNTLVLTGLGDGQFVGDDYVSHGVAGSLTPTSVAPSRVSVIGDPFIPLTVFRVGGTGVGANLIVNGSFDTRDQTGENGNFNGWTVFRLKDELSGSAGGWRAQRGNLSPLSNVTVGRPPDGIFRAMLDQADPGVSFFAGPLGGPADYAGTHVLYQDVFIPTGATAANLTLNLLINSEAPFSDTAVTPSLDYRTPAANQQVRIDIVGRGPNLLDTGAGVLQQIFITNPALPRVLTRNITADLRAFAGQTIRLRIASANNSGKLIVGIDNVQLDAEFADAEAPVLSDVGLRNRSFLSNTTPTQQGTDNTLVGQVGDNGSINNIASIVVDVFNDGFGGADDVFVSLLQDLDPQGRFAVDLTTARPGRNTINVRVTDNAGNFRDLVEPLALILQGPSLATWQSVGPNGLDVAQAGNDYQTMSGKVTAVAVDPRDSSGQTIFIGSANGGVWRSADGGDNWQALTDNVTDAQGRRVNVPIGAITIATNGVIYAATGLEDVAFSSRSGIGILRSDNDGRNWTVMGQSVFQGAQIAKIVVDPTNANKVYVAVTAFDDPSKEPGIFRTVDGGVTWNNVLLPQNMFLPGRNQTLGAGTPLASVTDIIIDPFNVSRLIVGMGNIGKRAVNATAGVWRTTDQGATWELMDGGDDPGVPNNTLPTGTAVGRVTVAQGTGKVADQDVVYALMSQPIANASEYNAGRTLGLYKTKDNFANFTKVMLRQQKPILSGGDTFDPANTAPWEDIEFHGNEGAKVGAMVVDPTNANVVYVGGSERFVSLNPPSATRPRQHGLLRVDTGNMRDTTYFDFFTGTFPNDGDDIDKKDFVQTPPDNNNYPGPATMPAPGGGADYNGEGVFWYDLIQRGISETGFNSTMPGSILAMTVDNTGRFLFGTDGGVYRANARGFIYDFSSGGNGILAQRAGANQPQMLGLEITELNGNLQIADLTSVAIDPLVRGRYYMTASSLGSAVATGGLNWETLGLTSPIDAQMVNGAFIRTATPLPGDTETTIYRTWQFRGGAPDALKPEVSTDSGQSFGLVPGSGVSATDQAFPKPAFFVNPVKVNVNGVLSDEMILGTQQVYYTRTNANVFDNISANPLAPGGFVTALAIAQSANGVYYAGTDDGRIFFRTPTINFTQRNTGIPTGVRINNIIVDPTDANIAYALLGGRNGIAHVFRTTNAGLNWSPLAGSGAFTLPDVAAHTLAIDKRPAAGAPGGFLYVGTDQGVFVSNTNGAGWAPFGQGLPTVPVVDLQFNQNFEQLLAATQGRGAWVISTQRSGPFVNATTPTTVQPGGLNDLTVTFNTPISLETFTTAVNAGAREAVAGAVLGTAEYRNNRALELFRTYLRRGLNPGEGISSLSSVLAQPNGDARVTSIIVASPQYFTEQGGGVNATWLNRAYNDLFGRNTGGDPVAATRLAQLNAGTLTRQQITDLMVADDEYRRTLATRLLTKFVGVAYGGTPPAGDARVDDIVAQLNAGRSVEQVVARLLGSDEAYAKFGTTLPVVENDSASSVAFGNFSGASTAFGPVPDLAVALAGSNVVQIFRGKLGGGYDAAPALTLALPAGASPSDLLVADFNGDGMDDLAVANGGLTGAGSVSVFLNNRTTAGQISFAARQDLNGGSRPVALAAANIDGDAAGNLDLAALSGGAVAGNFNVSVFLGDGAGGFSAPTLVKVGDTAPNAGEINNPAALAIGHVVGNALPDFVVAGSNGVAVLTNNSTAGTVAFTPLPTRVSILAANSVAVGTIDTNASNDIAFTTDVGNGQVVVLRNDNSSGAFTAFNLAGGISPRAVQLRDLNRDGKNDIVVANADTVGSVSVLKNQTEASTVVGIGDTVSFAGAVRYLTQGDTATTFDLADTNQDGMPDIATGHANSDFVTLTVAQTPGTFRTPNDRNWLDFVVRSLFNRAPIGAELFSALNHLSLNSLVSLNGPAGPVSPLAIRPTDATNQSFVLSFGMQLLDGTYTLTVGPTAGGATIKDLIDRDGTYVNVGNPMNQDRDIFNGEFPADRFVTQYAVNTSDTGRFITQLYRDLLGLAPNGRDPETAGFVAFHGGVEAARRQALAALAPVFATATQTRVRDIVSIYKTYLRRDLAPTPNDPAVAFWLGQFANGGSSQLDLLTFIIGSDEYFNNPAIGNGNNATWLARAYQDLFGRGVEAGNPFVAQLNAGVLTRASLARILVFSDESLAVQIGQTFQRLLGRLPGRNIDPALDEPRGFFALLRQGNLPGQPTPFERFVSVVISSPEYLQLVGNGDLEWVLSMYQRVLNSPLPANDPAVVFWFNNLQGRYQPQRQAVVNTLVNSAEFRARVITEYFDVYLSPIGSTRAPSAAELAAFQNVYAANGGRFEGVLAAILALDEYVPLNISANVTWLNRVYDQLLGRGTAGDPGATAFLNFLNVQPLSNLANARFQVALTLLNSDEYHRLFVAQAYNRYLKIPKAIPPGFGDAEVNFWTAQMNAGLKQEGLLAIFLGTSTYFLANT